MARIAGVDLPKDKRIEAGLCYIFGVGPHTAREILSKTGVNPDTRVHQLSDADIAELRAVIENDYAVEGSSISAPIAACATGVVCPFGAREPRPMPAPARVPVGLSAA